MIFKANYCNPFLCGSCCNFSPKGFSCHFTGVQLWYISAVEPGLKLLRHSHDTISKVIRKVKITDLQSLLDQKFNRENTDRKDKILNKTMQRGWLEGDYWRIVRTSNAGFRLSGLSLLMELDEGDSSWWWLPAAMTTDPSLLTTLASEDSPSAVPSHLTL